MPVRGGRRRTMYEITEAGRRSMERTEAHARAMRGEA